MEFKYLGALVIGLIMLVALFAFIKPKIALGGSITENDISIPDPTCYTNCAKKISIEGGNYKDCVKTECTS